jgi:hypothetical protein
MFYFCLLRDSGYNFVGSCACETGEIANFTTCADQVEVYAQLHDSDGVIEVGPVLEPSVDQIEPYICGSPVFGNAVAVVALATSQAVTVQGGILFDYDPSFWKKWAEMQGTNRPLRRSQAGKRDFDINLEGVAHYGMLPDFIQDLKNVGLSDEDLTTLFRSVEDYIQTWEKCEQRKGQ